MQEAAADKFVSVDMLVNAQTSVSLGTQSPEPKRNFSKDCLVRL